ncbi:MAG: hypothetical protein FJZ96_10150 [Chloroflexi bacterium]|nr:hypothetical protein [Chloroflexota bacterium]
MKLKILLIQFGLTLLAACAAGGTIAGEPAPTPLATLEGSVETDCPFLEPLPAEEAVHYPRVYASGFCGIHFIPGDDGSLTGLFIGYPAGWAIAPAGEDHTALVFSLDSRVIYFQAFQSDLGLDTADQVTWSMGGEAAEPVILADEVEKDRGIQAIGEKQTLVLTTTLGNQTIRRYFLTHAAAGKAGTVYMFQLTVLTPEMDNTQLLSLVEELINNISFDQ